MSLPSSTVRVQLRERAYDIEIGTRLLRARSGSFIADRLSLTHAVVITDGNVHHPHAVNVADSISEAGANVELLVIDPGESSKSVQAAQQLWTSMLETSADRKSVVVAAGGGVVGDLAGFIAATYGRGVPFIQIPTTLLAQVDSSVGGKVGINLPGAKNMVGAFWQPSGVLIDMEVLETLPDREYRAGLAEVVKYGVILDESFFVFLEEHVDQLNQRQAGTLQQVVARCCRLKADVVEADERETTGQRAVLNYGHTFGHAIEAVTGYGEYLHGEAISLGMLCASRLADRLKRISPADTERQLVLLRALNLPTEMPSLDVEQLLRAMQHDKKTEHGKLRFVLPSGIGHVELVGDVDADLVRQACLNG